VPITSTSALVGLGSTNGTLANGAPVAKHFLRDGDQIDIGRHMLVFCVDDDTVLAPDIVRAPVRSAVGDLGERVEAARPFVKARNDEGGSAMRRDRVAENNAAMRAAAPEPVPDAPPPDAVRPPPRVAAVRVLSGPGTGRDIPITKARTTIGRAGVQVALLTRTGDTFALSLVEGERPPLVNGAAPAGDETILAPGDVIEIAGARLEFAGLPQAVESH
jgi:hypothetical protein